MSDEKEEKLPMLEQVDDSAPVHQDTDSPADRTSADPAEPEPDATANNTDTTDQEAPALTNASPPDTESGISTTPQPPESQTAIHNHTDESNKPNHPVKPPRVKSMRSKEGNPQVRVRTADPEPEAPPNTDIEAAALITGATGDGSEGLEPEPRPYEPTTAPLPPKQTAVPPKKKFGLDYILGNKWIILGIIAVLLIILIMIIVGVSVSRHSKNKDKTEEVKSYADPVANNLLCGQAVGSWELNHTVAVFKGIPYLRPPVGNRRWAYESLQMTDVDDCANSTEAKTFKGPCFQSNPIIGSENPYVGSEDCLYLNIWAPAEPDSLLSREEGERLPVLVYIHGGFLHYGSGHEPLFSPNAQLADEMNAVIVSFNYRLNVFGWLALKGLVLGETSAGNFGLYDQISALQWVQEYIENFGGDPDKVTVAGLSSGGTSILALLSNPDARKTFQRAWVSGASSKFDQVSDGADSSAYEDNKVFLRNLGCKDTKNPRPCLVSKTKEELVDAIPWKQYPNWEALDLVEPPTKDKFIGPVLITDKSHIPEAPDKFFESAPRLSIPILIGNNEYESDMYQVVPVSKWTWGQYSDYVRSKLDTFNTSWSDYILNEYASELYGNPRLHMAKHVSDMRSICPQTFIADIITNNTDAPVYRYVNTAKLPLKLTEIYQAASTVSTHGTEFALLFHYSDKDSQELKSIKERFRAIIKDFIVNGNITGWQTFPTVYELSSESADISTSWTTSACQLFRDEFYPDYSWMN